MDLAQPSDHLPREVFSLYCYRCGHAWISRDNDLPRRCPRCHSSRWDNAVKKDTECKFCGHHWRLSTIDEKCPECGMSQIKGLADRSLHCNQCDHDWIQRFDSVPGKCPMCRSSEWNAPKHKRGACSRCGHVWRIRTESPKKCPKCQSEHWDGTRVSLKCYRCGHEWTLREGRTMADVKICPSCKTKKWNESPKVFVCTKCGKMHLLRKNSRNNKCAACDPYRKIEHVQCHLCGEMWESSSKKGKKACPKCGAGIAANADVSSMDIWSDGHFTLRYVSEEDFGFVYLIESHVPAATMYFHQLCRIYNISAEQFVTAVNNRTMDKEWEALSEKMHNERNNYLKNVSYFRKRLGLEAWDAEILALHFTGMGPDAIAVKYGVSYDEIRTAFDRIMNAYTDSGIVIDDTVFTENPFDFY